MSIDMGDYILRGKTSVLPRKICSYAAGMRFPSDWIRGLTPMLVLETVAADELSGLHILARIKERGEGLDIPDGTIYPLLYRLEKQGLLRSSLRRRPRERSQRVYELTDAGRRALAAEKRRWHQLVNHIQPFLAPRPT
jgi:PadR family transcriptional regulator, regulatory protein PadR